MSSLHSEHTSNFDKGGPQKMFKKDFMYFSVTLQKEKFQDLIQ